MAASAPPEADAVVIASHQLPELAARSGLSLANAKAIAAACRTNGIRLIPQINLLGHQSWQKSTGALLRVWHEASMVAWLAVAWQVVGNMLLGYGAWNWLLARYPAATVAGFRV